MHLESAIGVVMKKHILIIQGHPDNSRSHLCHALADAYALGAREGGHAVESVDVAGLDIPILRRAEDWVEGNTPDGVKAAQKAILKADHLVLIYPLWLGTMPALLKAFLEQAIRPRMLEGSTDSLHDLQRLLKGKSARIVVTMGMPAIAYRFWYRMHSVKSLQRNILGFVGVMPIFTSLIGLVDHISPARAQKLLFKMTQLGRSGR